MFGAFLRACLFQTKFPVHLLFLEVLMFHSDLISWITYPRKGSAAQQLAHSVLSRTSQLGWSRGTLAPRRGVAAWDTESRGGGQANLQARPGPLTRWNGRQPGGHFCLGPRVPGGI